MKYWWVFWVLILWLMAPYLDLIPESALQETQVHLAPQCSNCPWFKFGKYGCPLETLNCSSCLHTIGKWNWFEACREKTTGYLMRTKILWWLGVNSVSELGKVWKKLPEMIPRPLVGHFDLYCVTCALVGSPQILQGSDLSSTEQRAIIFRMNQAPAQGFEADLGNQTTGLLFCPRNASSQASWGQQWLLKLSHLVWTSDILSDKLKDSSKSELILAKGKLGYNTLRPPPRYTPPPARLHLPNCHQLGIKHSEHIQTTTGSRMFLKLHHFQFFLRFWKLSGFPEVWEIVKTRPPSLDLDQNSKERKKVVPLLAK